MLILSESVKEFAIDIAQVVEISPSIGKFLILDHFYSVSEIDIAIEEI